LLENAELMPRIGERAGKEEWAPEVHVGDLEDMNMEGVVREPDPTD
jgi:hypothetical protein